ncbi:cyclic nucleotide-binding domain-containing protein [Chlamydiifrater phoenicopteri]|uniref:cyclic nucleotide-binding domain-containing protein n=1 Tax=Chlamydiifrater phoenicopteri TaxID=2681469 RepID=UPI001BCB5669|nr:cyclic nucleotide-binding domain-containing protein [Chlamydiifrater phoenicopteri]
MNLIDKAFLLKKTSFFSSLDMDVLLAIADRTDNLTFKPKSEIFEVGQPGFSLYIIAEGTVTIRGASKEILDELKPEECFGEESLFNNRFREYSALAKTFVRVLALSKGQFLSILEECPSVALSILELYSKQVSFRSRE